MELGVNPAPAATAGNNTVMAAQGMRPVRTEFENTVDGAVKACGDLKGVTGAFKSFQEQYSGDINRITDHGEKVGGNVTGVSSKSVGTDTDTSADYASTPTGLPSSATITRSINH